MAAVLPPFSMLHDLARQLAPYSETPNLDAQVLLANIVQKPRSWVVVHPEAKLKKAQEEKLAQALLQIKQKIPLPYIIGHWEFFGLDFILSPDVLIPRPETEELVEKALDYLHEKSNSYVLDMGTGSGCIPISLAWNVPDIRLVAVDKADAALKIARQNAAKHGGTERITFIQSDLFSNVPTLERFNVITANLPYIPTDTLKTLDVYTREPTLALDGGPDGLTLIRRLLTDAPRFLAPKGLILLEIDASHGPKALKIAQEFFPKASCKLLKDLSGRDRFITIQT